MVSPERLLEVLERFDGAAVVLFGDLVLDRFILGTPKRISREAPVVILRYEGQRDIPGGGANALANLAALGVKVAPVGAVGDDEPGEALLQALRGRGIATDHIVAVPGFRTPTKVRILGGGASSLKHQEDHLPADGRWRARLEATLADLTRGAGAVAISDYGYGAVTPELVKTVGAGRQGWVCLDSRYRLASLAGADGVTPNLQELESFAGRRLATDRAVAGAAEELRRRLGARFVLATRGNQGMTLVEEGLAPFHVEVFGTDQVADVTGAGDTVLAVLTAALAAGAGPREAAVLANLAGGVVVMKLGTAAVSRDELVRAVTAWKTDRSR